MNKNQGATIGAILLAGLFLRPGGVTPAKEGVTSIGEGSSAPAAASKVSEGPWIASCRYWAARRDDTPEPQATAAERQPVEDHESWLKQSNGEIEIRLHATAQNEDSPCRGDEDIQHWGLPSDLSHVNVETIIATVPDPVHTHLAIGFDRAVDALLLAAADNGYVSSYYWLPWKMRSSNSKGEEDASNLEPGHNAERERQPGLIILKEAGGYPGQNNALFLFLVAESPTVGVDSFELKNAFKYERQLQSQFLKQARHFQRGRDGNIAIVGPVFTGSAQSLREGIEQEAHQPSKDQSGKLIKPAFEIAGQTSSYLAMYTLGRSLPDADVSFISFTDNFEFEKKAFLNLLKASGYDSKTVTLLVEDNTALGYTNSGKDQEFLSSNSKTDQARKIKEESTKATEGVAKPAFTYKDVEWMATGLGHHPDLIPKVRTQLAALLRASGQIVDKNSISDEVLYHHILSDESLQQQIVTLLHDNKYNAEDLDYYTTIRFPREISLLRNAQAAADIGGTPTGTGSAPSPYLHLSLRDYSAADAAPHFARDLSPLSQESQLMGIARQLRRSQSRFVIIVASNVLDGIFLSQFLHRVCPDVRQVFFGADDLMVREVDNVPFIGSLTFGPYTLSPFLTGFNPASRNTARDYSDSQSEAYYNSASWLLWSKDPDSPTGPPLRLKGYRAPRDEGKELPEQPSLWAMTIGADGYYPLGILNSCSSNFLTFVPAMNRLKGELKSQHCTTSHVDDSPWKTYPIHPSLFWKALCVLIALLCFSHALVLWFSSYWSPLTRDVAVEENDMAPQRSAYLHVSAAVLFCMAFIIAYPAFALGRLLTVGSANGLVMTAFGCSVLALAATFWKTRKFLKWKKPHGYAKGTTHTNRLYLIAYDNLYFIVHLLAWATVILVPVVWHFTSTGRWAGGVYQYVGISFNFRNLYPGSGVSPLTPILLLFAGWYVWAVCQTKRLRFSPANRPHLPLRIDALTDNRFFVSFEDLGRCRSVHDCWLYDNMTCPFITRQLLTRNLKQFKAIIDVTLILAYAALFIRLSLFSPMKSLDRFLGTHHFLATPYEWLAFGLFFTLISSALAGWLRILAIWSSLRRGLLDKLEHQPIRFGFSRFKGIGWMTLLRQGGIEQQWHDIARSLESMRQILNEETLLDKVSPEQWLQLQSSYKALQKNTSALRQRIQGQKETMSPRLRDFKLAEQVEETCAVFSQNLLEFVLIPYWEHERTGLVESPESEELPIRAQKSESRESQSHLPLELHASPASADPVHIQVAEEFLVIRYISLIRAVLANVRHLMTFVSTFFVLAIVAWNSYPFQPRHLYDWIFTALLIGLGSGIVWVFAQMYRNPLLSRITETKPNELGLEFYIRILSFGAVPVFTWLAYQFPDIGGLVFKVLQPGLDVMK